MTNEELYDIETRATKHHKRRVLSLIKEIRKLQQGYKKLLDANTRSILAREAIREAFEGTLV